MPGPLARDDRAGVEIEFQCGVQRRRRPGSGAASCPRTAAITRFTWLSASAAVASRVARSATPTASRSWAAIAGHAASRSLRCRSAQPKQLVTPGMTSGPTSPMPSRTRTGDAGRLGYAGRGPSEGRRPGNPTSTTRSTAAGATAACGWLLWAIRAPNSAHLDEQVRQRAAAVHADRRRPAAGWRRPRVATPAPTSCADEVGQVGHRLPTGGSAR